MGMLTKRPVLITLLIGIISCLLSCSNEPDFSEFEEELFNQINFESQGNIKLLDIEKTNSEDNEVFGQKTHTVHYRAEIEFLQNCWIYVDESGSGTMIENFRTYSNQPEFIPSMSYLSMNYKKGDIIDIIGSVTYIQTEKGWLIQKKPKIF